MPSVSACRGFPAREVKSGGLVAYRMTAEGAAGVVDTFEPVDSATVVALE